MVRLQTVAILLLRSLFCFLVFTQKISRVHFHFQDDPPPNAEMYHGEETASLPSEQSTLAASAEHSTTSSSIVGDSMGISDVDNSGLSGITGSASIGSMDHSGLSSDLSLEVPSDLEAHATDFTGSTINLQDLE